MINSSLKLLLIQCPAWGVELPPINLALLKAAVLRSGFKCEAWDLNVQSYQRSPVDSHHYWGKHSLTSWVDFDSFNSNRKSLWNKKNKAKIFNAYSIGNTKLNLKIKYDLNKLGYPTE